MAGVRRNLFYTILLSLAQLLIPLVSISYVSRVLMPDEMGKVYFIDSVTYFFTVFAEFGIISYGVREMVKVKTDKDALGRLTSELLCIQIISSLVSFVFFLVSIFFLRRSGLEWGLVLPAFIFFLSNFFYTEWYFWGTGQFGYVTLRSILLRLASLAALWMLVNEREDYQRYYMIMVSTSVLTILINIFKLSGQIRLRFSGLKWRKHLPALYTINGITLLGGVFLFLDIPVLRFAHSTQAAGLYGFAIKMVRIPATLITDFLLVLYPHSVDVFHNRSREHAASMINKSIHLLLFLSIPLCMGLFVIAEPLTSVFLGEAYAKVSFDLRILSIFPLLISMELFFQKQILLANHQEQYVLRTLGWIACIFLAGTYFLSRTMADTGTSIAMVGAEFLLMFAYGWRVMKSDQQLLKGLTMRILQLSGSSLLFIPIAYLVRFIPVSVTGQLAICILSCVFVYAGMQLLIFKNEVAGEMRQFVMDTIRLKQDANNK
jgi:O-antigen/teichoic acid export membrane protein